MKTKKNKINLIHLLFVFVNDTKNIRIFTIELRYKKTKTKFKPNCQSICAKGRDPQSYPQK